MGVMSSSQRGNEPLGPTHLFFSASHMGWLETVQAVHIYMDERAPSKTIKVMAL